MCIVDLIDSFLAIPPPLILPEGVGAMVCLIIVFNWSPLWNSEQSESRNSKFPPLKSLVVGWWGGVG